MALDLRHCGQLSRPTQPCRPRQAMQECLGRNRAFNLSGEDSRLSRRRPYAKRAIGALPGTC